MKLKPVSREDAPLLQGLLEQVPRFFQAVDGCPPGPSAALELLHEMPQTPGQCQKLDFFIEENDHLVGGVDVLFHYPEAGVAFIGLFFLIEPMQGMKLGKKAYAELEALLVSNSMTAVECGVVDLNPVEGFWQKMGFDQVVRSRNFQGKHTRGCVTVLRKNLAAQP